MTLDECKDTTAVENYRVEKLKELQTTRDNRNIVKQDKLQTQKEIITLQLKKKDLEIAEDKANNSISALTIDIELAKTKYWSLKS